MATHTTLASLFSDIANAIRAKTGKSGQIIADNFPTEIAAIETGVDTDDANATAGDMLSGATGYVKGEKVTGNIPRNSAISATLDANNTSQAIPTGYYGTAGSVSIVPQTKTVTPSTSAQTVTADSGKVMTGVTVNAIPNQRSGKQGTITPATSVQNVNVPAGWYNGDAYFEVGSVNAENLDEFNDKEISVNRYYTESKSIQKAYHTYHYAEISCQADYKYSITVTLGSGFSSWTDCISQGTIVSTNNNVVTVTPNSENKIVILMEHEVDTELLNNDYVYITSIDSVIQLAKYKILEDDIMIPNAYQTTSVTINADSNHIVDLKDYVENMKLYAMSFDYNSKFSSGIFAFRPSSSGSSYTITIYTNAGGSFSPQNSRILLFIVNKDNAKITVPSSTTKITLYTFNNYEIKS